MRRLSPLFFLCAVLAPWNVRAQEPVVQVSGVLMSADSISQFIPHATITVEGRKGFGHSGDDGFFSVAVLPGDTIYFHHIGFEDQALWIPDTLEGNQYLAVVRMKWKVDVLNTIILYPWPSPDNFAREFLAMQINTTETDIANRNLAIQSLKERAAEMGYDGAEMQDYAIKTYQYSLYNEGRYYGADGLSAVLGRLSNPFAWQELFRAINRGDFD